ncbi:PKAR [Symbiodinium natans]|uniref:PKAR protein n=1 Tax=Symbiodinium natans TaxID=878477 RepID=A0A812QI47_9DINO|nr:PKAR [Symbiodinium natans]
MSQEWGLLSIHPSSSNPAVLQVTGEWIHCLAESYETCLCNAPAFYTVGIHAKGDHDNAEWLPSREAAARSATWYFNIITRSAMRMRTLKEKYLRQVPIFETFDDELIARITDIVEKRTYQKGQLIIKQGEEIVQAGKSLSKGENVPAELYILLSGECEASIMVDVVGGNKKEAEEQAVREYKPGQRFGELGFIHRKTRQANVTAKSDVELPLDQYKFQGPVGVCKIVQVNTGWV